jgi:SWIB/MDM2 domain
MYTRGYVQHSFDWRLFLLTLLLLLLQVVVYLDKFQQCCRTCTKDTSMGLPIGKLQVVCLIVIKHKVRHVLEDDLARLPRVVRGRLATPANELRSLMTLFALDHGRHCTTDNMRTLKSVFFKVRLNRLYGFCGCKKYPVAMATSRLPVIWKAYLDSCQRIDELEKRMEDEVMRKRRRIANLLDEVSSFRKTHTRIFVSHRCVGETSYEIIIEGKLLVGHLDHQRAKEVDDMLYGGQVNPDIDPSDRSQYRGGISERESDTPVEPIYFTHLFDEFQAKVYTVWHSDISDTRMPFKRLKGKRQSSATSGLLERSSNTFIHWKREPSTSNPDVGTSSDSHAFVVQYTCPDTPSDDWTFHSIVVEIKMWPRPGDQGLFLPSLNLAKEIFPEHVNQLSIKRRIQEESDDNIATNNEVFVPSFLTMEEIVLTFFQYVQVKKLQDKDHPSIVICDKSLKSLFECDRFNFADLQYFLLNKNLVSDARHEFCFFTYIIHPKQLEISSLQSVDLEVYVPSLFHYRCRELLRRLKQREFEYTSSRTKARNWLMTGRASEDRIRQLLDDCVTGQGYTRDHLSGWLALARAAPEGSEARQMALLDAQISFLLDRAECHAKAAKATWDFVEKCQQNSSRAHQHVPTEM